VFARNFPAIRLCGNGDFVADKGGVVRLAQLQAQGYAYLRP